MTRELRHAHDPVNVGQWAMTMTPDFAGRSQGGDFLVVFSYREPVTNRFLWALGHSAVSLAQARAVALNEMAKQRFDNEIDLLLIDH